MQAIILAAGRGKRMAPLTDTTQKAMLKVGDKTLLEHKLDLLPDEVTEVIFVIGYLGDQVRAHFGNEYKGKKVHYVEQKELLGTAHSLWQAKDLLTKKFIVMMGDDLYHKDDIRDMLQKKWSILVHKVDSLVRGGKVELDEKGILKNILEGDNHGGKPGMIYTGLCVLTPDIFKYDMVQIPGRNEYGLPQTILTAAQDFPIEIVESRFWMQVTDPEDLKKAESLVK